mgnify:CR=1 FL=1
MEMSNLLNEQGRIKDVNSSMNVVLFMIFPSGSFVNLCNSCGASETESHETGTENLYIPIYGMLYLNAWMTCFVVPLLVNENLTFASRCWNFSETVLVDV